MPPSNQASLANSYVPTPLPSKSNAEKEKQWILDQFYGGISDAEKQIVRTEYLMEKQYQFASDQNGNILEYPNWFQINRASVQDSPKSGTNMLTAMPKWICSGQPYTNKIYIYCADGKMFSRDTNGQYQYLFTAQDSQGNGLAQVLGYIYYSTNSSMGIYGPLGSPNATNNDAYLMQGINNTKSTGIAPINVDFGYVALGHGNNMGTLDVLTGAWSPTYMTFNTNTYVRSFTVINQMLGIGVAGYPSQLARNFGYIYIWDGASTTFNASTPVDESLDFIYSWKNNLIYSMGHTGALYQNMAPSTSLQRFPLMSFTDTYSILPGAVTDYKGQMMIGVAGSTTSSTLPLGVYHWGNRNDNYPAALNMDYTISTGNTSNIQIGALFGSGDQLFIGWADNNLGTYGVDVVQPSNPYYSTATVTGVIVDDLRPVDDKNGLTVKASHRPLRAGESIQLGFSINRGPFVLSTANTTVGSVLTKFPINQDYAQFKELQCKFIIGAGTNNATTPTLTSIGAAYMPSLTQSQY